MKIFQRIAAGMLVMSAFVSGFAATAGPSRAVQSAAEVWPEVSLASYAEGFHSPVVIIHAGDGSGRLFVVEQGGSIQILRTGVKQAVPFLDITDRVLFSGEQGLLGLAFPPEYNQKGYFYIYYTGKDGNNRLSRVHLTSDPDQADSTSEELILLLEHPLNTNHNGGQIAFGPDGYLYVGTGDGGGTGDPQGNAQNLSSLLGKILRLDVEAGTEPYALPPDNPYLSTPEARPEIWAAGLRNPWRFSFDQQTGDLYIADVGQNNREEVNFQPAASQGGENYGWAILEGTACYEPQSGCVPPAGYVAPVAEYEHGPQESIGCSVTGGYVYRGGSQSMLAGIYLFSDFCTGRIWGLKSEGGVWLTQELLDSPYRVATFGEDQAGELYLADYGRGNIYRVTARQLSVNLFLPLVIQ